MSKKVCQDDGGIYSSIAGKGTVLRS